MKRTFFFIFLVLSTIVCSAQKHRALIVGVANYPEDSGWKTIHSDNDVSLLCSLLKKNDYLVDSLVDGCATRKNIINALDSLENETENGDTIVISFSCHGQQMITDGKEEKDSLDEALIPFDAKLKYSDYYKGENHITDNFLSNSIAKIRKKAGNYGLVLVLLDACHSGDSFKGSNDKVNKFYRGVSQVFGADTLNILLSKRQNKIEIVDIESNNNISNVLYIGACQSYQINAEMKAEDGKWYGSLSYAFYEAFKKNKFHDIRLLCVEIRNNVKKYNKASRQCPEFASSLDLSGIFNNPESNPPASLQNENISYVHLYICIFFLIVLVTTILVLYGRRNKR